VKITEANMMLRMTELFAELEWNYAYGREMEPILRDIKKLAARYLRKRYDKR